MNAESLRHKENLKGEKKECPILIMEFKSGKVFNSLKRGQGMSNRNSSWEITQQI